MRVLRRMVMLGLGLPLAACGDPATSPAPARMRPLTAPEQAVVARSNGFAFSLLNEVSRAQPNQNVFLSPLSASMALGMTMNGAAGGTLDAMRSTLGFGDQPEDEINASYESLIAALRAADPRVEFRIANSIWYRQGWTFEPAFLEKGRTHFDARIAALDFDDPAAPRAINDWVQEQTRGRINRIVESIDSGMVMYLINAIYFKGSWKHAFDKRLTADAPFGATGGPTANAVAVKMMAGEGSFAASTTESYQAVDLPYGDGLFSMTVVVPRGDVDALASSLDAAGWEALLAGLSPQHGSVQLPRFTLSWKRDLKPDLTAMGMGVAFSDFADFSRMHAGGGLLITEVLQKTWVDVNEEGTEAAAATSVGVGLTSAPRVLLRADRPFLVAIRERTSGAILFVGKVVRP